MVLLEKTHRHRHIRRRHFRTILGRDQRQTQHFGQAFAHFALGHQAQTREQRHQIALAVFLLQAPRAHQIRLFQAAARDQMLADAFVEQRGRSRFLQFHFREHELYLPLGCGDSTPLPGAGSPVSCRISSPMNGRLQRIHNTAGTSIGRIK